MQNPNRPAIPGLPTNRPAIPGGLTTNQTTNRPTTSSTQTIQGLTTNRPTQTFPINAAKLNDFKAKLKEFIKNNKFLLIFIGVVFLIFIAVIVYIWIAMKTTGLNAKTLTKTPIRLIQTNSPQTIMNSSIPVPTLGKEFGYSFWLYIENYDQTSSKSRVIWYRGNLNDISSANPLVYMDATSNKMYLCIKSQNATLNSSAINYNNDVGLVAANNYFMNPSATSSNAYLIMTIDYVPLQKWINIVINVDNQMLSVYLDGEIYSVKSIDDFNAMNSLPYNIIVDKTDGDIYIGANPQNSQNITINGYMRKLDFFTYALSARDVKKVYGAGPFSRNFMSMIGLGSTYGVRSPVYKIGDQSS